MTYYDCPVCGYDELSKPPKDYYICPSCGTEFESDDFDCSYAQLRSGWIEKEMPWFDPSTLQPKNWSGYRQLIVANYGSDLTRHPRFKIDVNYRYAVNRAFSEVRIAKQLKVTREVRKEPLTQLQLAEKAGMKQSRISELEGMNYSSWTITTLERLAEALGVGFRYSFVGWGDLIPEIEEGLTRSKLWAPSFGDDPGLRSKAEAEKLVAMGNVLKRPSPAANVFSLDSYRRQAKPPIDEPKPRDTQLALIASGK